MIDPNDAPMTSVKIPPGTDLTCLLESMARGGAMAHANLARLSYREFQATADLDAKRLYAAEIFCKLMQAVEDLGAFALFSLSGNHDDIASYFSVVTAQILTFYGSCQSGLTDAQIDTIYGLPAVDELIRSGHVAVSHRESCEDVLQKFRDVVRREFRQRGLIYAKFDDVKKKWVHSDLLNMYFKAKHGMRVFLPTPEHAKAMDIPESHVAILIGVRPPKKEGGNDIEIGSFRLDGLPKLVANVTATCTHLKELAEVRLGIKTDPLFVFKLMRDGATDKGTVEGIKRPGRNQPCFCKSGKKFKRCHGQ